MIIALISLALGIAIGMLISWTYFSGQIRKYSRRMKLYNSKLQEVSKGYNFYVDQNHRLKESEAALRDSEAKYRSAYLELKQSHEAGTLQ